MSDRNEAALNFEFRHPVICAKCKAVSGDSWTQCSGKCPLPGSPHYDPETAKQYAAPQAKLDDARERIWKEDHEAFDLVKQGKKDPRKMPAPWRPRRRRQPMVY